MESATGLGSASRLAALAAAAWMPLAAAAQPSCAVERAGDEVVLRVDAGPDALGGRCVDLDPFCLRALLVTPPGRDTWLVVEVHARSEDAGHRIVSAQKVSAPFSTGFVEVVEPTLGRSLRYRCGESG